MKCSPIYIRKDMHTTMRIESLLQWTLCKNKWHSASTWNSYSGPRKRERADRRAVRDVVDAFFEADPLTLGPALNGRGRMSPARGALTRCSVAGWVCSHHVINLPDRVGGVEKNLHKCEANVRAPLRGPSVRAYPPAEPVAWAN